MSLLINGIARLGGFAIELLGLRNFVLIAILITISYSLWLPYVARLANWVVLQYRSENSSPDCRAPPTLVEPMTTSKPLSPAPVPEKVVASKETEPVKEMLAEPSPSPAQRVPQQDAPMSEEPSNRCNLDWLDAPNICDVNDQPAEMFDLMCGFDELWSSDELRTGRPEAAVTADANSVLETALASGDAKAADAAIAAGIRLCNASWIIKACNQLQALRIPVSPERALDVVRVFGRDRRADLAFDFWQARCEDLGEDSAEGDEHGTPPLPELYSAVLEVCAQTGDFETAAQAASSTGWRVPTCRHGQVAFLALARWYARRQDVSQALVCYQAVREVSCTADLPTHRAILIASVRSADMAKADMLFRDLVSSGITPDGASFSAMICGHCSAGNVDKAMQYFRLLRERGIVPTAPLFDAILDGCAGMNMPVLMEQVLAEMEATGVRPSTSTLSILVRLHGMNRDTDQAIAIFDELPKKHGLKLDGHAYGTLISVCLKNDSYDMAWNAFERMFRARCTAHARIYEALITACLRHGCLDNAVQVIYEALGIAELNPDQSTATPRMRLQQKTLEDVIRLIGRRRQSARLGAPLVKRLLAAGIEIADSLVTAVLRNADKPSEGPYSELQRRRALHQEWRNFPMSVDTPLFST